MEDRWSVAAALVDGSRRALYDYVRRQGHPVSREEAAEAVQISRGLAAFHLDKLVEVGLLRAHYRPPPGRPRGRGRSPKVYEPAQESVVVTIPERRYELIAEILADGMAEDPADAATAARRHAHRRGRELGRALHAGTDPAVREPGEPATVRESSGSAAVPDPAADLSAVPDPAPAPDPAADLPAMLARLGFEPATSDRGELLLHNCPFHALAVRHTALVCGLNHAFLAGLVDGLGAAGVRADLVPRPGACCVTFAPDHPAAAERP